MAASSGRVSVCRDCGVAVEPGNVLCPGCARSPRPAAPTAPAEAITPSVPPVVAVAPEAPAIQYDPKVIEAYARALYSKAALIIALYAVAGAIVLGPALAILGASGGSAELSAVAGMLMGGGVGYFFGQLKANAMRLEAQIALCQVAIEKNTRIAAAQA